TRSPNSSAWPAVGRIISSSIRMVVDLPAPLSPEERVDLAAGNAQVDPIGGEDIATVSLGQPGRCDREISHARDILIGAAVAASVRTSVSVSDSTSGTTTMAPVDSARLL